MAVYEFGDTVNLSWAEPGNTATVVLYVTAPDGTESSPATAYTTGAWRASVTGNQYDQWLFTWVSSGTFTGTEQDSFTVGGPWYTTMAALKKRVNRAATDTSADDQLAEALDAATGAVEEHCDDRVFFLDTASSARTFPTRRSLCLPEGYRLPVDDIGYGTLTAEVGDGTTWTTLTDIETYPENAIAKGEAIMGLVSQTDWSLYRRARITAKWGWPSIPNSVKQATLIMAHRYYDRKNSPQGIGGGGESGLIRLMATDPDATKLLEKFTSPFQVA